MLNFIKNFREKDEELGAQEKALLPSILVEQLSAMLLGLINLVVMGSVSSAALAGVGQVNTVNNMIVYFFNSFAMGGTVMVAQNIGAKNHKAARDNAGQSMLLGFVLSLVVTVVLLCVRQPFLYALFGAAKPDVLAASSDYFFYSIFTTPLWFIYFQSAGVMRGAGDTKTPMRISIIMNIVNLALSCLLVMVFHLDAVGAGIAMLCSIFVGAVLSLRAMTVHTAAVKLPTIKEFHPSFKQMGIITSIGIPAALENLMFNGGKVLVQVFIAGMGTAMISAYQVANSGGNLLSILLMAYNVMIVTIVGQRAGTGNKSATKKAMDYIYNRSYLWSLVITAVMVILAKPVSMMFTSDADVIPIATRLIWIFAAFTPIWVPSFVVPSGFRGTRDVKFTLVFGTISMWACRVGLGYVLGVILGLGAYGIYIGMGLDWLLRTIGFSARRKSGRWLDKVAPLGQNDN